jgi:hypothetical protein
MELDLPIYKIKISDTDESGIDFISLVANPAILLKGLTFKEEKKYQFQVDEEKMIIAGPAIIPDMKIFRTDDDLGDYYVVFEKQTIEEMVEKFNKSSKEFKLNVDHSEVIAPAFIKGSWIIEDEEKDKSKMYGFELPVGTWFIEVKVTDKDFWNKEIKEKGKFGFSVEGLMGLKLSEILKRQMLESYDDYPKAASENACKVLRWRDEYKDEVDGMTRVGWIRANQLCNREPISEETIARMSSFKRHQDNAEISDEFKGTPWKDRGYVAWLGWGGTEGIEWASSKLDQIRMDFEIIQGQVNSSNVDSYRYNDVNGTLDITFNSGDRYRYYNVTDSEFEEIILGVAVAETTGSNEYGSWFTGKIPSVGAAIWKFLRDTGKRYTRLSEQIINNKQTNNQKMKKRLKFAEYTLDNGTRISVEGDLAVGSPVYVVMEDGALEQAPSGEHTLEDGTTIFVDEEGLINEVRSAETSEVAEENREELQVTPEEIMVVVGPMFEEMRSIIAELQSRIEMLEGGASIEDIEDVIEEEFRKEGFSQLTSKISKLRKIYDND